MTRSGFGRGRGAKRALHIRNVAIAFATLSIAGVGLLAFMREAEQQPTPMVNFQQQPKKTSGAEITLTDKESGTSIVIEGDALSVIKEVVEAVVLDDKGKIYIDKPPAMAEKTLVVLDRLADDQED